MFSASLLWWHRTERCVNVLQHRRIADRFTYIQDCLLLPVTRHIWRTHHSIRHSV